MFFKNRTEAGKLLANKLNQYKHANVVVLALPRGGVVTAAEVARYLSAPLDLVITRKIGHPYNSEYAIAAIAENGYIVGNQQELDSVDAAWLNRAISEQQLEIQRRRRTYLQNSAAISLTDKIAIIVDDGIATGLTMRVAIKEVRHKHPQKLVVAVPVIPQETYVVLQQEVDEVVALDIAANDTFLGAVGAYYATFPPVEDDEVIHILGSYRKQHEKEHILTGFGN